ncbi:MAG TPA: helix-turn-helix domain-containing protein [Pirellulales bacterium]|jgi:HTH-type transcriptional regulator/antitoxin HigA|nr:helix-turn-helix domain-containing protein [Pirellulales bacterium]
MATISTISTYDALLLDAKPRPIRSDREYHRVLRYIEAHMEPHPSRAKGDLLELLSGLVVQYESQIYPAPNVSPREMLAHLIDARQLSRAEVARVTGIPRATISNILNGTRGISKTNAMRLAEFFHVAKTAFLGESS